MIALPLFVYGSLRDPEVRTSVLGERPDLATIPATLPGHSIRTVPGFGYPFAVPGDPDDHVDGELILGLTAADRPILDAYEDVDDGLYVRAFVTIETAEGRKAACTYLKGPAAPS